MEDYVSTIDYFKNRIEEDYKKLAMGGISEEEAVKIKELIDRYHSSIRGSIMLMEYDMRELGG
jgi:hypothetical protein